MHLGRMGSTFMDINYSKQSMSKWCVQRVHVINGHYTTRTHWPGLILLPGLSGIRCPSERSSHHPF